MYELLFRSRWYAFAWSLIMAASAIMFTTTGAGAWLTGTGPDPHASGEAREIQFRSWAEDDKRRLGDDQGYDPSSPEHLRDGRPPQYIMSDGERRSAPFLPGDPDDELADDSMNPPPGL